MFVASVRQPKPVLSPDLLFLWRLRHQHYLQQHHHCRYLFVVVVIIIIIIIIIIVNITFTTMVLITIRHHTKCFLIMCLVVANIITYTLMHHVNIIQCSW